MSSGFSFGSSTGPAASTGAGGGGFSFGGSTPSTGFNLAGASSAPAAGTPSMPSFSFGATPSTGFGATSTPAFSFGQTSAPATSAAPATTATTSTPATTASAPAFSFGAPASAPSAAPAGTSSGTSTGSSFSFGQTPAPAANKDATSGSTFSFGSKPAETKPDASAPSSLSLTTFGAAPASSLTTQGAAPATSTFNFGAAAPKADGALVPVTSIGFGAPAAVTDAKKDETPAISAPAAPAGAITFGSTTGALTAAPSFSFSMTPATTAAGAKSTDTKPAEEKADGGAKAFSFGAAAPAPSTGSTPASGGFGFGTGPSSTTPAAPTLSIGTPAASTTATASAPATETAAGGTSSGDSKPAASAQRAEKGPSPEYSSLDIKTIIQQWYRELAQDAVEFETQAHRVNAWDRQLRENQKTLEHVVENVHRIMASHSDLRQACESIEAYQTDLESDLQNLSSTLEVELESLQLQEPSEDDYERENAFVTAEALNDALSQMEVALKKIVMDYNHSHGVGDGNVVGGNGENPLAKIVAVLNTHQESLTWLDEKTRQLQSNMEELRRGMVANPMM